jgi:hypothetical protein
MPSPLSPLYLLLTCLAGWIHREQQRRLEYVQAELAVLREMLGKKRLRFSDEQRRRLAAKGKEVGREGLLEIGSLVTPDTLLRWHRELIAQKWTFERKSPGRPPVSQEVVELTVKLAHENPGAGYDRLQGMLANLGHDISDTTVKNILKQHGIEPSPVRVKQTTWADFLRSHTQTMAACDFFTSEVWTLGGLVTFYVFFVIEVATRRVQIAGITTSPDSAWMKQVARNLTDCQDGFLKGKTAPAPGPGHQVHRRISGNPEDQRDRARPPPAAQPQPQRLRRALGPVDQGRVFGQNDLLRREDVPARGKRVRPPLPCRAKSSRTREQNHPARTIRRKFGR